MMHNVPQRLKMSLMMTIGNETVINYKLQKEPFNTNYFVEYLQTLLPSLDPRVKIILMDNVAFHKSKKSKGFDRGTQYYTIVYTTILT